MSGGPPHHPHNRHVPPTNSAWNHLQVPTYFQRQPQVAHMQAEHTLIHQPTWHTPTTTEAMKLIPHTQMLNDMFKTESLFPRDCVDLSLTRNVKKPFLGGQNGELPSAPAAISLSVRDANKINSLPPGMLDIQAVELVKCASPNVKSAISPSSIRGPSMSPGMKAASPGLLSSGATMKSLSPGRKSLSPGPVASGINLASNLMLPTVAPTLPVADLGKNQKRSNIRVDSILERLNTIPDRTFPFHDIKNDHPATAVSAPTTVQEKSQPEKLNSQNPSVIVQTASNFDENSNSSGTTNVPTPKEEDSASMHSNEDSLDSTKSRRKRKPSKTVRVNKDDEIKFEKDISYEAAPTDVLIINNHKGEPANLSQHSNPASIATILEGTTVKLPERLEKTTDEVDGPVAIKSRRKASSESETIDNIAAMVQEGLKERKTLADDDKVHEEPNAKIGTDALEKDVDMPIDHNLEDAKIEIKSIPAAKDLTMVAADITPVPVANPETSLLITVTDFAEKETEISEDISKSVPVDTVDGIDMNHDCKRVNMETMNSSVVSPSKPVTISVIQNKEKLEEALAAENSAALVADLVENPPVTVPPVPRGQTPVPKNASNTNFVEVENKLEEMFAGIVENHVDSPSKLPLEPLKNDLTLGLTDDRLDDVGAPLKEARDYEVTNRSDEPLYTNHEVKNEEENDDRKPVSKKARRSRLLSRSDNEGDVPMKKKKLTKTKGTVHKKPSRPCMSKKPSIPVIPKLPIKVSNMDVVKDIYSYDSGSNASSSKSRGPFLQIRGPRDSPLSVSVVNTPLTGDEDAEKKTIKNKKFHDDSEYRHKVRSKGLHCSTLSNKYDAERKDASWICAFCKRGPHASEFTGPSVATEVPPPGDLFGPYFITNQCPEFEKRLDDVFDRQFKSRKISKALDAAAAAANSKSKKAKRKLEPSVDSTDLYLGITDTGNNTFEVWVHEDCMVWSPGVYLVGPKIAGLEEAVWTCSNLPCSGCGLKGANVTCVKRGCLSSSHVCCARKSHWQLDEANFKAYCPEHLR
ncbi:uncharacterized protein CG5098 isoform X1 [Dendroctonus ponderosae]|uniref:PHD-type domain-containing protein n=1 Tax=Dendroctonus ponderosae TaxID=77166 RepID=A0AAR5PII9_DENPD|nr:uncharacterized protein CG5098 isoform X1 [Dendroctonus ponderosae]XP_048519564.1 uncharacterized protein CG5098 isoform X1 [Dendroctonus ponderosae]XP_048519565.1 uncharacterized protein CG5098 isoform X1 [Dendroctonus ponderosae]XP_048519566.1 uncharacterized protein CG5098 isoform X1 [Dendroctonus ponderosae]XP_048519567.1 uncharacterized protein CG5098 isoform X1 [Dendroctonus ponderosae]XP_048519568.1 uncharacterized protein CG5098 isoform X1 [Dendroctonus ponderosae]XP_048519569.1 un